MCGSTSAQTQIEDQQMQAYTQLQQLTQEQYANQQAILGPMTTQLQSIFAKGPSQEGFNPAEKNTLNAQSVEGTAENYSAASRALGEKQAASGGGNIALPQGAEAEERTALAASSAGEQSKEQTQITEADYAQGHSDWENAGADLLGISSQENPLGYISNETSAGSAASNTANQVAQEQNSWVNAVIGGAGEVAGGFAGDFNFGKG